MKKIFVVAIAFLLSFSAVSAQEFGGSDNGGDTGGSVETGGSDLGGNGGVDFGGSDLGGSEGTEFGGSDLGGSDNGGSNDNGSSNNGGSSGSRGHGRSSSKPTVLGASTGPNGEKLSCDPYIIAFMRIGLDNDASEVIKLQSFLNEFMGAGLPITGYFGPMTYEAVMNLQAKYATEILKPWDEAGLSVNLQPTGYEYIMTRWFINTQKCKLSGVTFPKPDLKKEVAK